MSNQKNDLSPVNVNESNDIPVTENHGQQPGIDIAPPEQNQSRGASQGSAESEPNNTITEDQPRGGEMDSPEKIVQASPATLESIPVHLLAIDNWHPREIPGEDIDELVTSIERDGLIELPIVREASDGSGRFVIESGTRRIVASKQAGKEQVECIVMPPCENVDSAHRAFMANKHRKSLTDIEDAKHYKRMQVVFGLTLEQIGERYKMTKASVSQKLSVLNLPESIQKMISDKSVTFTSGHGRLILKLDTPEEQKEMAKLVVDKKLSVSQTKTKVDRCNRNKKRKQQQPDLPVNIADIEIDGVHCHSSEDMSKEIGDGQVHLIVTSPPWGNGMEFEKKRTPMSIFEEVKPVFDECERVLCPGGIIAINLPLLSKEKAEDAEKGRIQPDNFLPSTLYLNYLKSRGLYLATSVVWWKQNLNYHNFNPYIPTSKVEHTCYKFVPQVEVIHIFRKIGKREVPPPQKIQQRSHLTDEEFLEWGKDIWVINKVANDGHPCRWPDELPERLVRMFSYEGDTVLDPFLGSGTTVKVARDLGRTGIGYERDLKYKPVIMKTLGMIPEEKEGNEKPQPLQDFVDEQVKSTISSLASPKNDQSQVEHLHTDQGDTFFPQSTQMKALDSMVCSPV